VDWYAFGVEIASDGIHMIRSGWVTHSADQEAIAFFANGKLIRSYSVGELVHDPDKLPRTVSGRLPWRGQDRFDDERMEYTLETSGPNLFVFDVRTGGIVSESRAARPWQGVWWAVAAAVGAGVVAWLVWGRRKRAAFRDLVQ
jgi:hypothetical protein